MGKLSRFFQRIGLAPNTKVEKTFDFLCSLQYACVTNIAYENLDILANQPLCLDPDALFDKIVTRGRGGYCFELNGLLADILKEMGFSVSERFARFLRGIDSLPMRRHRVVIVHLPDGDYLCDIGIGQIAPKYPLKIEEHTLQAQKKETYRFVKDAQGDWVLWELYRGQWCQYLSFDNSPAYPIDFLQPTFYCEKHPDSIFNKTHMIAIKTETGRRTIDHRTYKEFDGETLIHIEENISNARLQELLNNEFRLK